MIYPGEHVCIFGMTGSGKSTLTYQLADLFPRKIIFDRMGEWSQPGPVAHDFQSFLSLYKQAHTLEAFQILIQPMAGMPQEELLDLVDQCLSLIYRVEKYNCQGLAVIFEEAWLYAPLHATPTWFNELLFTGRKLGISLICNSQRAATVSASLRSQSRHLFIGQYFEKNDTQYYFELLGPHTPPQPFEFIWRTQDKPSELKRITTSPKSL